MAKPLLDDDLWNAVAAVLPTPPERPLGGRPRLSDRQALTGVLFVLRTGTPWEELPRELGCGSGMTCWRRLQEWRQAGVWERVQAILAASSPMLRKLDWTRAGRYEAAQPSKRKARRPETNVSST